MSDLSDMMGGGKREPSTQLSSQQAQSLQPLLQIVADLSQLKANTSTLMAGMTEVRASQADLRKHMDEKLVTKEVFEAKFSTVQRLVYGAAGLMLTAILLFGINQLLNAPP